jgi:hypothetical protein
MELIKTVQQDAMQLGQKFDIHWLEQLRVEAGADLLGVLAIDENSHPDILYGVKTFLPSAKACVVVGMEYDSETMNLIKHPVKYAGSPKTGELLAPHVNQLNKEIDQACYDVARSLKKLGYRSIALPSRGLPMRPGEFKASVSYAHVAEAAGMGTIGTHSLLITPEFGTRTRLTCLFTEAPLKTTRRIDPVDDWFRPFPRLHLASAIAWTPCVASSTGKRWTTAACAKRYAVTPPAIRRKPMGRWSPIRPSRPRSPRSPIITCGRRSDV